MTGQGTIEPRLSNEQLARIIPMLKSVDSVELKVSVAPEAHRATIQGLPIDPVEAQPRQVYFFDTPELASIRPGSSSAPGGSRVDVAIPW
jgi:hypothetical protein